MTFSKLQPMKPCIRLVPVLLVAYVEVFQYFIKVNMDFSFDFQSHMVFQVHEQKLQARQGDDTAPA
jgi:hypothetical protein